MIGVLLSRRMLIAERSEREGAALYRAIVDEALDCIITADRDGRILDFNPAAERTFGWTRDEAIDRSPRRWCHRACVQHTSRECDATSRRRRSGLSTGGWR